MDSRAKLHLLTLHRDLTALRCLEIGAREAPLLHRTDGHVLYADYADTASLRASLDKSLDPAALVQVDLVTGEGDLSTVAPHDFDVVIASHVIEHVPDILGWLNDLRTAMAEGATLGLAIPDRRFTFDRFRAESTIAEAVEAYLLRQRRPSLRQVFDSAWQSVEISVPQAWANDVPENAGRAHRLARLRPALGLVTDLRDRPRYNDAHCWVFTPASFLNFIQEAQQLGLLPFTLEFFQGTRTGGYEFYAVLRAASAEDPAIQTSIRHAQATLATSAAEQDFARAHASPAEHALRARAEAAEDALRIMRSSTFWRATAPLRALLDVLRRR